MLSEEIKEATKINHQLLEKKLIAIIRSIRNKSDYAQLLVIFYRFFGSLEITINRHLDLSCMPDYPHRRKSVALANDLNLLGLAPPQLPNANELPEINDHFQATGALYVIEGSTLGGRIISKIIQQQLNLADMNGLTFFKGYGDRTYRMWQHFKYSIDQVSNESKKNSIIQSANDTFIQFSKWFDYLRF